MAGVAFKKTFSYAGFEMQRKRYEQPKIALLNIELELKAEKENAELRIDNVEVWSEPRVLVPSMGVWVCVYRSIRRWWMQSGLYCMTSWRR